MLHSLLVTLNGGSGSYLVIPVPAAGDKEFAIEEGFDYYAKPSLKQDIAGGLHEEIHNYLRCKVKKPDNLGI